MFHAAPKRSVPPRVRNGLRRFRQDRSLAAESHLPKTRLALARILAAEAALSLPRFTICVALAFALAACERSGMGYFREPGRPKLDFGKAFLRAALSLLMTTDLFFPAVPRMAAVAALSACGRLTLKRQRHRVNLIRFPVSAICASSTL